MDHEFFMSRALDLAAKAVELDEVPVGALIADHSREGLPQVIAEAYNNRESARNPIGHAELLAIAEASEKLGRWRLSGCTLYVTLEPCLMCAGAIILARLDRVVYGCRDPKAGAVHSLYQTLSDTRLNHRPEVVSGVLEGPCAEMLKKFFRQKRE